MIFAYFGVNPIKMTMKEKYSPSVILMCSVHQINNIPTMNQLDGAQNPAKYRTFYNPDRKAALYF